MVKGLGLREGRRGRGMKASCWPYCCSELGSRRNGGRGRSADRAARTDLSQAASISPAAISAPMSAPAGAGRASATPTTVVGFGIGGSDLGTHQTAGLVGGVQGGCDYQVGSFVFGVQGMFDGASMKGNQIWQASPTFTNNGKIPWFGTVTGRVGSPSRRPRCSTPRPGVAVLHHDYSRDRFSVALATGSSTAIGWTAGVGVEWIIIGTWSLWAEYNYIGIGQRDVTFSLTGAHCNCRRHRRRSRCKFPRTSTCSRSASTIASSRHRIDAEK